MDEFERLYLELMKSTGRTLPSNPFEHTGHYYVKDHVRAAWEGFNLQTALQTAGEWISVSTKMPEHGKKVIATYKNSHGNSRVIVGHHIERWKEVQEGSDDDCATEYSEELDQYFYLEGWYEQQDNWGDYSCIFVHEGEVIEWKPLPIPSPPESDK